MENSVQKLIEEIAQIAEKYDVVSRCVLEIREMKKKYNSHIIGELDKDGNLLATINPREWKGIIGVLVKDET